MENILSEVFGIWFLIGADLYSSCRLVSLW